MSQVGAVVLQALAAVALAPLLPGLVQAFKARLQGRRGPSPLQPYRELVRLWGKSRFQPEGATWIYPLAPAVAATCLAGAILVLAPPGAGSGPLGHDALVLIGLLALARFALGLAAWDTGSGFALLGAARDLVIAVSFEGLLVLCLALAALPAGSTDLAAMSASAAGFAIWLNPSHWCALVGFALVTVAETGRQPIDNPDTHLELTMVHEGLLLEYSGRDLAYLQWVAAARHWVVLSLGAALFLPHMGPAPVQLLEMAGGILLALVGLGLTETLVAKMRLLRIPVLAGAGGLVATIGIVAWFVGPVA